MSKQSTVIASALLCLMNTLNSIGYSDESSAAVDFENDIAPILSSQCVDCHNAATQMADLRLDTKQAALDSGSIEPGDGKASLLIQRLYDKDLGLLMPPTGKLPQQQINILRKWVDEGAKWPAAISLESKDLLSTENEQTKELFAAIRTVDHARVRQLLEDSTLLETRNRYGSTPLIYASLYADAKLVRLLLDKGADPHAANTEGLTALMMSIRNAEKTRLLLESGAAVNAKSGIDRTALMLASAYAGNKIVVEQLLQSGADVNAADKRGWTALIMAARTGDTELMRVLIDAGANVNAGNAQSLGTGTALTHAAWAGNLSGINLLLDRGAESTGRSIDLALIFGATHGYTDVAQVLLENGAKADAKAVTNYVPDTPLLAASYSDHLPEKIVGWLLERGADPNVEGGNGHSPMELATARGETATVRLLRDAGATSATRTESMTSTTGTQKAPRAAAQSSVQLLQSCDIEFYSKSGCIACHQHTASLLGSSMARNVGLTVDEQTVQQQLKLTVVDLAKKRNDFLQRVKIGGTAHRISYLLWGMAAADYPADEVTDAAAMEIAGLQLHDGSWVSDAHRPPTEYSKFSATAVSLYALHNYAPPGMKADFAQRIARAKQWLNSAQPRSNQDSAFRLLGLHWSAGESQHIKAAAEALLKQQRDDGGWAQLPNLESDAYATGLSLYALHLGAGLPTSDPRYQSGLDCLLKTQKDDGSWHVQSRSMKFQPYFESGFPHGDDQWISAAATGWGALAIMQSLNDSTPNAPRD